MLMIFVNNIKEQISKKREDKRTEISRNINLIYLKFLELIC